MAYSSNAFCWTGIVSSEPERTARFCAATLGWDVVQHTFRDGGTTTMCMADGTPLAHIRPPQEGEPSHWLPYLRVDIVDTVTARAEQHGGQVAVPPTTIDPGRFSVVSSPSGARFALFHEDGEATSSDVPSRPGHVHWTELHSTDIEADLAWLKAAFGYELGEMPIPSGTYHLLKSGDADRGGAMASEMKGAPSLWMTWIEVADCDETVAKITEHGGSIMMEPTDMEGIGRMAVATEPTGGLFGVITPPRR